MPQHSENKKITLYAIVEDTKETAKKIKENAIRLLNNRPIQEKDVRSLPLFPSFRGSLVDAAEKVTYERQKWLRLVLKTPLKDVVYPAYQFEKSSDVPFYLLDAYEEAFEQATQESSNPPKYIENGQELGTVLKVHYIDGENKRFSFLYKDKESGMKFLSPVYQLKEHADLFRGIIDWFMNENQSFKTHYNTLLKRTVSRQPSEIVDATNPNIVTVVNPANVSVVCTDAVVWPKLMQVTRIDNKILPVRSDYKYFLKQDMTHPRAFNMIETAQGRSQIGWKYTIDGGTIKTPQIKKGHEKIKMNLYQSKTSFWRWLINWTKKAHTK